MLGPTTNCPSHVLSFFTTLIAEHNTILCTVKETIEKYVARDLKETNKNTQFFYLLILIIINLLMPLNTLLQDKRILLKINTKSLVYNFFFLVKKSVVYSWTLVIGLFQIIILLLLGTHLKKKIIRAYIHIHFDFSYYFHESFNFVPFPKTKK